MSTIPDMEARLRAVEDRLEILDLIARYGPAADTADAEEIGRLWAPDGEYRFDDTALRGPEVSALVELSSHRALMAAGCAHFLSSPLVRVDGDEATAINHSIVLRRRGEHWAAVRVSANRWELVRRDGRWRVRSRRNALLDGSEESRRILDQRELSTNPG